MIIYDFTSIKKYLDRLQSEADKVSEDSNNGLTEEEWQQIIEQNMWRFDVMEVDFD